MHIKRQQLRELQYLQEDIAEYFTDENMVSGETYWTCIESIAIATGNFRKYELDYLNLHFFCLSIQVGIVVSKGV